MNAISLPEPHIDLARAALYIAAEEYPELDVVSYLGRVALLAQRAKAKLSAYHSVYDAICAVNAVLFEEDGFRRRRRRYDPRDSFLSDVMDRRAGAPLTVSLLYAEIARRLGYRLPIVGLPGRFALQAGRDESEIYVDMADRGGLLTRRECLALARRAMGSGSAIDPASFPRRIGKRALLRRMLTDLKLIFMRDRDYPRALRAAERIRLVQPDAWQNLGDLVRIQTELGQFVAAAATLQEYLARAPQDADARAVRRALRDLRYRSGSTDGPEE